MFKEIIPLTFLISLAYERRKKKGEGVYLFSVIALLFRYVLANFLLLALTY